MIRCEAGTSPEFVDLNSSSQLMAQLYKLLYIYVSSSNNQWSSVINNKLVSLIEIIPDEKFNISQYKPHSLYFYQPFLLIYLLYAFPEYFISVSVFHKHFII